MQQLESGLKNSINHYGEILAVLQNIDKKLGTASQDELQAMNASLTRLQDEARELDQLIVDHSVKEPVRTEAIRSLLRKRESVVREILHLNKDITARAMGVKALLAHEMGSLRNGISALSGYKPQQHNHGRIVNSAS